MNPTTIPLHTGTSSYPPHHLSQVCCNIMMTMPTIIVSIFLAILLPFDCLFACSSCCWNLAPTGCCYCYCYSGSCYYYCIFLVIVIVAVVLVVFFCYRCGSCCCVNLDSCMYVDTDAIFFPSCITWGRNQDIENIACKF